MTKFRTQYDDVQETNPIVFNEEEGLTKQSFKDETDVNRIVARYQKTGVLPQFGEGRFADVSNLGTYHEALDLVLKAQETFAALPAEVRLECGNDPQVFVERVQMDQEWAIRHGLATPPAGADAPPSPDSGAANTTAPTGGSDTGTPTK